MSSLPTVPVRFNTFAPASRQALDAIEFAYARGAAPLTDVLDARRVWRATQSDLAQARADHAKALASWRAASEWETSGR